MTKHVPRRNLRSVNIYCLVDIGYKLTRHGSRSFFVASGKLWNVLPPEAYHLEAYNFSLYVRNNAGVFQPTNQNHGIFFCPNMESADYGKLV